MTLHCLQHLQQDLATFHGTAEVVVVDNASTDGSIEHLRQFEPRIELIANSKNRGFGAANNQGMQATHSECIILLNSDAFVRPGFTQALVDYLRAHPRVGMVGPRLYNEDRTIQTSVFRFPTPARAWLENLGLCALFPGAFGDYRRWDYASEREVDWVSGAVLATRRTVFDRVGGFDEGFFMYSEEADWQLRIRRHGYTVRFVPAAEATHLGGGSGQRARLPLNFHFFRSQDYYQKKNHGVIGWLSYRIAMLVGAVLRVPIYGLIGLAIPSRRTWAWDQMQFYVAVARRWLLEWPS